ncbi:MAG: 30S ribosomal protein S8e [Thermoplasmata archaeon]|nr:30S ribosomal protein S8e [Thermoplasmata archaeon]
MALWQGISKRKITGGRIRRARSKRRFEIGGERQFTNLGEQKTLHHRTTGGDSKRRVLAASICNLYIPKEKKTVKAKILTVKENPSNPNYVQRNIITKSALVGTDMGDALITSRPGQDGVINARLISAKK